MKKQILFILALTAPGICGIYAQVLIGSCNRTLHEGAALELKSDADIAGLLMPRVELTSATVWAPVDGGEINGMTVYNTNDTTKNGLSGKGVYTWTDGRWYPVSSLPCTSAPEDIILKTSCLCSNNKIDPFKPFLLYVDNPEPGVSYKWTLPQGLIGSSTSNVITVAGIKSGVYNITVEASNECGVKSLTHAVTIESFVLPPNGDMSNMQIQGPICYDIAKTDDKHGACGDLAYRRPAFPDSDPGRRSRVYTLSIQDNSNMSDLKVGWMDDADNIIKSVSGDVPGPFYKNEYPVSVVFVDDINARIKYGHKSTARLYAIYKENGKTEKSVTLTITVQDCSCCPLNVAVVVPDAAYKGPDIVSSQKMNFTHFKQIPNAAICLFKTDQGNYENGKPLNYWDDAAVYCSRTMAQLGYGEGWRLPNLGELYFKLYTQQYMPYSTSGNNGRFLASTGRAGDSREYKYHALKRNASGQMLVSSNIHRTIRAVAAFRCVKTIDY
jgi:hypothetical protein